MSGAGLGKSKRVLDDAADQVLVREPDLCCRGSVLRIQCKIRVWVYVDDEGRAGWIDTKIESRIAAEPGEPCSHNALTITRALRFSPVPSLDHSGVGKPAWASFSLVPTLESVSNKALVLQPV
jgi:hypothetical protein